MYEYPPLSNNITYSLAASWQSLSVHQHTAGVLGIFLFLEEMRTWSGSTLHIHPFIPMSPDKIWIWLRRGRTRLASSWLWCNLCNWTLERMESSSNASAIIDLSWRWMMNLVVCYRGFLRSLTIILLLLISLSYLFSCQCPTGSAPSDFMLLESTDIYLVAVRVSRSGNKSDCYKRWLITQLKDPRTMNKLVTNLIYFCRTWGRPALKPCKLSYFVFHLCASGSTWLKLFFDYYFIAWFSESSSEFSSTHGLHFASQSSRAELWESLRFVTKTRQNWGGNNMLLL